MKHLLAVAILLFALMVPASQGSTETELPGSYPEPVTTLLGELLQGSSASGWAPPSDPSPNATGHLQSASSLLGKGLLRQAVDEYVLFRAVATVDHLADRAAGMSPAEGREAIGAALAMNQDEAAALVAVGRGVVNGVAAGNLTVQGAEAALLGTLLIVHGELLLNFLPDLSARDVYVDQELDPIRLRERVNLAITAQVYAAVGASIVSRSPQVAGGPVEGGNLTGILEAIADAPLALGASGQVKKFLPRGNATTDSPLLRAGLYLIAAQQVRAQESSGIYRQAADRANVPGTVQAAIASNKEELQPWAARGSALALASYELIDLDVGDSMSQSQLQTFVNALGLARTVLQTERALDPGTEREARQDSPALGGWLVLGLLAVAGLAARRRC